MKMIVGLGNPGEKYQHTRHNVGFTVVDELAQQLGLRWETEAKHQAEVARSQPDLWLVKPQTYMNASGTAVRSLLQFYKLNLGEQQLTDLYVVHDDLDLEIGRFKVQLGTGPKIHNGLLSLYQELGTQQFWHVRVGVDGRNGDRRLPGQEYVLQPFEGKEKELIDQGLRDAVDRLKQEIKR